MSHYLKWGEDIPDNVMDALRRGERATLHDAEGNPYSVVCMDYFGTIRESLIERGKPKACSRRNVTEAEVMAVRVLARLGGFHFVEMTRQRVAALLRVNPFMYRYWRAIRSKA